MTISNEAVEAALSAGLNTHDWEMFEAQQGDIGEAVDGAIRAALEAAAPFMRAQALEEAADSREVDKAAGIEMFVFDWSIRSRLRTRAAEMRQG